MPDTRAHRGPHPEDAMLFAPTRWPAMRAAVHDLSWLLSRGYGETSSLKMVGDRYNLATRQRAAVRRAACTDLQLVHRAGTQVAPEQARGKPVWIDGYNVLTTVEVALGGGVVIASRDGCYRDIAGVHGTHRRVEETEPAIRQIASLLGSLEASAITWVLDAPVSNSGRLRAMLHDLGDAQGLAWSVELVKDADRTLRAAATHAVLATADGIILDAASSWLNLAAMVIARIEDVHVARIG